MIFAVAQSSGTSPDHDELSDIAGNGLALMSAGSLSPPEWAPAPGRAEQTVLFPSEVLWIAQRK